MSDTNLSFIKLIELYQIRWTIEVFNKEAKGVLNLGGCQSSNFNAQIADTTISMITCILLSFRYRYEHYESRDALYRSMNAEYLRMTLDKRLWEPFLETIQIVAEILELYVSRRETERQCDFEAKENKILELCAKIYFSCFL